MHASIIIATRNRANSLELTLESLSRQIVSNGLRWEVIVIANSCLDHTEKIVRSFKSKLPVKFIVENQIGVSFARNTGIKEARGDLVLFIDDDVLPSHTWLEQMHQAFMRCGLEYFLGGPIDCIYEQEAVAGLLQSRYVPHSVRGLNWGSESHELKSSECLIGPNWGAPREVLLKSGGFDVRLGTCLNISKSTLSLAGEESDLMRRLSLIGCKGYYVASAGVTHRVSAQAIKLESVLERVRAYVLAQSLADYSLQTSLRDMCTLLRSSVTLLCSNIESPNLNSACVDYCYAKSRFSRLILGLQVRQ